VPSPFALNIYLKQKCALACREAFPLTETGKISLDGPVIRTRYFYVYVTCLPTKILIPAKRGNALPYVSYSHFFFVTLFLVFLLARHRKLLRMVKSRLLTRRRPAKGIFRASLLFLHPFRRRPQKLKCKAIGRWRVLQAEIPLSHLFEGFELKMDSS